MAECKVIWSQSEPNASNRTALGRTDESNLQAVLELYQQMLGE